MLRNNKNEQGTPEGKVFSKQNKRKMRLPNTIGIAVTIWLIFMIVIFGMNDIKSTGFYALKDSMDVNAFYTDGSSKHFPDGDFGSIKKGDRIEVSIRLPENNIDNAELYIPLYNAIVDVYLDGEKIFEEQYDPSNVSAHYGNRIYEIDIPEDYSNRELMLDITSVVSMPFSDLQGIGLVPANESWKRILQGESLIFSTSLALMILALISVFYFIVRSISLKKVQLGLPIALFELLINAWFFGSLRMFYLIFGNAEICAKAEYYALYLAPIPLAVFIYTVLDVPVVKRAVIGVSGIYSLYYVVATVIEISPIQRNYSEMLTSMHLLSGTTILILVVALFAGTKDKSNRYIFILRYGVLISMMCGILELLRFNITKYVLNMSWVSTHGVSAVAILVIAVSLVIYLISVTADEYTAMVERKQLMALAYRDALTDMPNRAACYKRIEEMEADDVKVYTMVFIDVNNLKTANDVYGHEMGDKLLKTTAAFIMDIFADDGFCARWGGDEFVACVFGDESLAVKLIKDFKLKMSEEDAGGTFPFKVSAACGYRYIDEGNYIAPLEAIREADAIMYENKKLMKAGREVENNGEQRKEKQKE